MIRKFFLLFLLPLAGAVTFYACQCKGDYGDYLQTTTLTATTTDGLHNNAAGYTTDSLFVAVNLELDCIAQNTWPANPFANVALATVPTRCPCGDAGFKEAITGITIYTDSAYAGYPAGADITALFTGFVEGSSSYPVSEAPQKFIENVRAYNGGGNTQVQLLLKQKPGNNTAHTFTVAITTANSMQTVKTEPFTWQ
jgi:hypothetical protein